MKTRYILYLSALAAVLASCAKETAVVSAEGAKTDDGVLYSFTATASDPMTKSFFKEEEAPSRYIYWEDTDEFDFQDITIGDDGKESVSVTSSKPSSMGASKKSVLFEKKGHDYMVISYPKGAVTLMDSTFISTYVSSKLTTHDTLTNNAAVKVSGQSADGIFEAGTFRQGKIPYSVRQRHPLHRFRKSSETHSPRRTGKDDRHRTS